MTEDPFSQPRSGNFPKVDELEGSLLLIRPSTVETVPNKFAADRPDAPKFVERATADVVVFGPDGIEEYSDMYLSQAVLLNACKQALKPGAKPFILGVLQKVATKDSREKLKIGETPEDYETAYAEWLRKGGKPSTQPRHVWILGQFSEDQAKQAREYIESKKRTTDPFAASETADAQ